MQGRQSSEFDNIVRLSHTPVCAGNVLDEDGKVEHRLILTGGGAVSDRMAAIRTTIEVEIVDPDKEIDYENLLFGKRLQLERGVLTSKEELHGAYYGTTTSWVPSGTSTGELTGVKIDNDGAIVLGP